MAQQTSTQEFRNSTRLGAAVICAGLCVLSLFPWFVTATDPVTDPARSAPTESRLTRSLRQKKITASEATEPAEIALDYHPSPGDPATFLVLREDGSLKLVRYDRRQLDVWEHQEGVLAAADVAELFKTIRKPTVRRALRPQKSHTRERGDADFFYLTLRAASDERGRWFSAAERTPRAVFLLVDKLLAFNNKFKRVTSGSFDRYLRVDNLSAQDTKAVLKKVRPAEIDEFPSSVRELMGRAVSHPKEFFLITAEQAGELERARKPILQHARSLYDLQLFDSLLVPPGKLIKEPPNEESRLTQIASPESLAPVSKSSSQQNVVAPAAKESEEIALDYHNLQFQSLSGSREASKSGKHDEIALDYHRWQGGLSTFVVVRDDGSVKLISYDRRRLTISEHQEGVLATSGVTELFTTVRKPTVRRALKLRKRYVEDWGDADLFYLTLRTKSGELTHWFSMGERAPRAIFFLVAKMLALNSKLKNISPGNFDRYLRAERLTPEDTRNVLEKVRPLEITQFSSALQAVVGRAVGHPREFFLLTAEQAGELQKSRTSMLRHATSVYTLQLFESLFVQPVNPPIIKPPIEASQSTQVAFPESLVAVNTRRESSK